MQRDLPWCLPLGWVLSLCFATPVLAQAPVRLPYFAAPSFESGAPPPAFAVRAPAPARQFRFRLLAELGGTVKLGRVDHFVDGARIQTRQTESAQSLHGALDARLSLQRVFGTWLALGAQLGWTNWQSDHLKGSRRLRSNYVAFSLQPELRLPLGSCRRCPLGFVALRAGIALAVPGDDGWRHDTREHLRVGVGALWGVRAGLELPLSGRISLRFSTGYEAAFLRNEVDYAELGSELLTTWVQRPLTTLGVSVGL